MKTFKNILVVALISLTAFACNNEEKPEIKTVESEINTNAAKTLDPNATYAKAEFSIDGMTCAMGCAKTIEKKIAKMDGVKSAKVDFDKRLAMVEYDDSKVTLSSLEATVTKAGEVYKVKDIKTVEAFSIESSCKADCKKACCAGKTSKEKKECAADCKKECCSKKEKA